MKILLISFLLMLCCISTSSSSPLLSSSNGIFTSLGRSLLQANKPCPINFEFKNYTIITSRCKGPEYPAKPCCDAFKEFACPYSDELNDLSNDCTTPMFNYINFYGNYTVGLFSTLCRDDKFGLICPALAPEVNANNVATDSNISHNIHSSSISTLTVGFLILFMWI